MSTSSPCDELTLLGEAFPLKWKVVGAKLLRSNTPLIFLLQGQVLAVVQIDSKTFSSPEKGAEIVSSFNLPGIDNTRYKENKECQKRITWTFP
jgi:hypothetical protein